MILNKLRDWCHGRVRIKGAVFKGFGVASKTLAEQMKLFKHIFPTIRNYHIGTINVLTEKALCVCNPTLETAYLKWTQDFPPESFKFVLCEIEIKCKRVNAVLYIPCYSPHTPSTRKWEIIASENVGAINTGDEITIIFNNHILNKPWGCII